MLDFSVTFIFTLINIAILFLILRKILFKPVTKFMAERAQKVQDSIDQAEINKADAAKLLAEYEAKLKKAEDDTRQILSDAAKNAERLTEQIIAEGKKEAANIIALAHKQIEDEHEASLAKFRLEAAALVIAAAAKLASRDFSGDDNKPYVNMLLEELSTHASSQKGRN